MNKHNDFRPLRNGDKKLLLTNLEEIVLSDELDNYLSTFNSALSVGASNVDYFNKVKNIGNLSANEYNALNSNWEGFLNQFILIQDTYCNVKESGLSLSDDVNNIYNDFSLPAYNLLQRFNGFDKNQKRELLGLVQKLSNLPTISK